MPDGDTGNNMLNTLTSMYSMIAEVSDEEPVGMIAEKAASGAIMGLAVIQSYFITNYSWIESWFAR